MDLHDELFVDECQVCARGDFLRSVVPASALSQAAAMQPAFARLDETSSVNA